MRRTLDVARLCIFRNECEGKQVCEEGVEGGGGQSPRRTKWAPCSADRVERLGERWQGAEPMASG